MIPLLKNVVRFLSFVRKLSGMLFHQKTYGMNCLDILKNEEKDISTHILLCLFHLKNGLVLRDTLFFKSFKKAN